MRISDWSSDVCSSDLRALSIPVIGGVEGVIARVEPGDMIVVDGDHAQLFVRPAPDVINAFQQSLALRQARMAKYAAQREDRSVTRDGTRVALLNNEIGRAQV